jgi:hypothetical protein
MKDGLIKDNSMNKIKNFLKFNWLSKKFFIRLFLLIIALGQIKAIYRQIDYKFALGQMGFVSVLIGLYTVEKIKK